MKNNILVFGGTSEGRLIIEKLEDGSRKIFVFVATEYGKDILNETENIKIFAKRLNKDEMIDFILKEKIDVVIDATHPFANVVTDNIKKACEKTEVSYIRFKRDIENITTQKKFDSIEEAVEYLKDKEENILITTGSKNLEYFTKFKGFPGNIFIRILPMKDSLEKASSLGFKPSNIICMQGPFSKEMNKELLKWSKARYMLSKNSGQVGGFKEKLEACNEMGVELIHISSKELEKGMNLEEIKNYFEAKDIKRFPVFIDLTDRNITIIGGGTIAERRCKTLIDFSANNIKIIAPKLSVALKKLIASKNIEYIDREYIMGELTKEFLVIVATDNREVNETIMEEAKKKSILCNIADKKDDCDFWFPAIAENKDFILAAISKNGEHKKLKEKIIEIREFLKYGCCFKKEKQ